uniref:Putative sporulation stage V protein G n=1 Tax=viral metagenome TaxID=1070528 RepID=A0A6M3JBC2_9ZZZZ
MENKYQIKIERIKAVSFGSCVAFCDISIMDAFVVKGLRIINGKNGFFVSMPSEKGKDGKYYDTVYTKTPEIKEELERIVLDRYKDVDIAPTNAEGYYP